MTLGTILTVTDPMRADRIFMSWLRTKRAMRMSQSGLAARRRKLWRDLQPAISHTPALAHFQAQSLESLPITDTPDMRADYGVWNSLGMSDDQLRMLADDAEAARANGPLSAGWSTGTGGGNRGLFLASEAERDDYIGQSLARLLPATALLKRQRLALHLRANNALYQDVQRRRFAFRHIPLETDINQSISRLAEIDPTILIAPPHRLVAFAKSGLELPSLRHLFYGSEPMSDGECAFVADAFGLRPRAIYQATEGFLGAECEYGRLHLNEHAIQFEFEPVEGTNGFRPIITDLRRSSQPIIRLRTDDFVQRDSHPCPCGFEGQIIRPIQGRVSDIWRFADRVVTPPQVVETVEAALGSQNDWQAEAHEASVTLRTTGDTCSKTVAGAAHALHQLTGVTVNMGAGWNGWSGPKRRKAVWSGA